MKYKRKGKILKKNATQSGGLDEEDDGILNTNSTEDLASLTQDYSSSQSQQGVSLSSSSRGKLLQSGSAVIDLEKPGAISTSTGTNDTEKTFFNYFPPRTSSLSSSNGESTSSIPSTLLPSPLAIKEIRRRKRTIDFLFNQESPYSHQHPKPLLFTYPLLAPPLIPSQEEIENGHKTIEEEPSLSSPSSPSSRHEDNIIKEDDEEDIEENEEDEEVDDSNSSDNEENISAASETLSTHSRESIEDESSQDSSPTTTTSNNNNNNNNTSATTLNKQETTTTSNELSSGVAKLIEALKDLGGRATGAQITSWIGERYGEAAFHTKRLPHTVNALLSCKKHSTIFCKQWVSIDGNRRAMWQLVNENIRPEDGERLANNGEDSEEAIIEESFYRQYIDRESFLSDDILNTGEPIEIPTDEEEITDVGEEGTEKKKKKKEEKSDTKGPDDKNDKDDGKQSGDSSSSSGSEEEEVVDDKEDDVGKTSSASTAGASGGNKESETPHREDDRGDFDSGKKEKDVEMQDVIEEPELHNTVHNEESEPMDVEQPSATENVDTDTSISNVNEEKSKSPEVGIKEEMEVEAPEEDKSAQIPENETKESEESIEEISPKSPSSPKEKPAVPIKEEEEEETKSQKSENESNSHNEKKSLKEEEDVEIDIEGNDDKELPEAQASNNESSKEDFSEDDGELEDEPTRRSRTLPPDENSSEKDEEEAEESESENSMNGSIHSEDEDSPKNRKRRAAMSYSSRRKSRAMSSGSNNSSSSSINSNTNPSNSTNASDHEEDEFFNGAHILSDDTDNDNEGSTYTEMIEQALKALGGRGTGVEITSYIDENYSDILSNKTKTWRNSVMGCLSANRRNLFAKEPVKENAKRYVWRLVSEGEVPPESTTGSGSAGKSTGSAAKRKKKSGGSATPSPEAKPATGKGKEELKPVIKQEKKSPTEGSRRRSTENSERSHRSSSSTSSTPSHSPPATPSSASSPVASPAEEKEDSQANLVHLIETALKDLGGKGTGMDVIDWIAAKHKDMASNKKKLGYTVNAILSAKKYKNLFVKDQMVQGGQRTLWKLTHSPAPTTPMSSRLRGHK